MSSYINTPASGVFYLGMPDQVNWCITQINQLWGNFNRVISAGSGGSTVSIGDHISGAGVTSGLLSVSSAVTGNVLQKSNLIPTSSGVILGGNTTLISSSGSFSATFPEKSGTVAMLDDTIQTVQVSLSSAQILNLFTTPVQLVSAPGAGKIIVPIEITWDYTFVTAAYDTNTAIIIWENSDRSNPTWGNSNGSFLQLTSSQIRNIYPAVAANGSTVCQYADNQPLMLSVTPGNPATGGGTAKITIQYKIITR